MHKNSEILRNINVGKPNISHYPSTLWLLGFAWRASSCYVSVVRGGLEEAVGVDAGAFAHRNAQFVGDKQIGGGSYTSGNGGDKNTAGGVDVGYGKHHVAAIGEQYDGAQ